MFTYICIGILIWLVVFSTYGLDYEVRAGGLIDKLFGIRIVDSAVYGSRYPVIEVCVFRKSYTFRKRRTL